MSKYFSYIMVSIKKFRAFDEGIFEFYPDLKDFLKPNDQYPELQQILKSKFSNLPAGSLNTKLIIDEGNIVERVFKTPSGQEISFYSKTSNVVFDQVA